MAPTKRRLVYISIVALDDARRRLNEAVAEIDAPDEQGRLLPRETPAAPGLIFAVRAVLVLVERQLRAAEDLIKEHVK